MRSLTRAPYDNLHLIKTLATELARMDTTNNQLWAEEYQWIERAAKGQVGWPHTRSQLWRHPETVDATDWLCLQLNSRAATGEFFGPNPDDPFEFGFWPEVPTTTTPPPLSEVAEALDMAVELIDSLLPQMGRVSVDVGLLNDTLIKARPLLAQFKAARLAK
jgi:hypothetical protein